MFNYHCSLYVPYLPIFMMQDWFPFFLLIIIFSVKYLHSRAFFPINFFNLYFIFVSCSKICIAHSVTLHFCLQIFLLLVILWFYCRFLTRLDKTQLPSHNCCLMFTFQVLQQLFAFLDQSMRIISPLHAIVIISYVWLTNDMSYFVCKLFVENIF